MASCKVSTPTSQVSNASVTSIGLQQLAALDRVSVNQKYTNFANKYVVATEAGEVLFNVKEDASALDVVLGGKRRAFLIDLYDANNQQVISLRRPYSMGVSKLQVRVCGLLVSVIREEATFMKPVISINDAQDKPVLRVKGPAAYHGECDFDLQTVDKTPIGCIRKKWSGLMREMLTTADQFHVRFPMDLDVRYKVAVISTCLLIDFLYYEKSS